MSYKRFRLFPVSALQEKWGLYLTDCGYETIEPGVKVYPPLNTPEDHLFTWKEGRQHKDYYILFVVKGRGYYQYMKGKKYVLTPGTAVLICPGVKHRHRPDPKTGWEMLSIGFNGAVASKMVKDFFESDELVFELPDPEAFEHFIRHTINIFIDAPLDYPLSAGGQIVALLGRLYEMAQHLKLKKHVRFPIQKARNYILKHALEDIDFTKLAREMGTSESTFRRSFIKLMNMGPLQFQIDLRLKYACRLLETTALPVAEISLRAGFSRITYFSRLFSQRFKVSPREYRVKNKR
jgi:AraC-like DNA-binding protein